MYQVSVKKCKHWELHSAVTFELLPMDYYCMLAASQWHSLDTQKTVQVWALLFLSRPLVFPLFVFWCIQYIAFLRQAVFLLCCVQYVFCKMPLQTFSVMCSASLSFSLPFLFHLLLSLLALRSKWEREKEMNRIWSGRKIKTGGNRDGWKKERRGGWRERKGEGS